MEKSRLDLPAVTPTEIPEIIPVDGSKYAEYDGEGETSGSDAL